MLQAGGSYIQHAGISNQIITTNRLTNLNCRICFHEQVFIATAFAISLCVAYIPDRKADFGDFLQNKRSTNIDQAEAFRLTYQ